MHIWQHLGTKVTSMGGKPLFMISYNRVMQLNQLALDDTALTEVRQIVSQMI